MIHKKYTLSTLPEAPHAEHVFLIPFVLEAERSLLYKILLTKKLF